MGKEDEKHVGAVGIVIKRDFRGILIEKAVIFACWNEQEKWGLKVLPLSVFANNKHAMHVYEKGWVRADRLDS